MGYGDSRDVGDRCHKGSPVTIWHTSRECVSMNDLEGCQSLHHCLGLWALQPRTVKGLSVADHLQQSNKSPAELLPELLAGVHKGLQANRAVQASKVFRSHFAVASIAVVFVCYVLIGSCLLLGIAK